MEAMMALAAAVVVLAVLFPARFLPQPLHLGTTRLPLVEAELLVLPQQEQVREQIPSLGLFQPRVVALVEEGHLL